MFLHLPILAEEIIQNHLQEINKELKDNVDYVVNLRQNEIMDKPSSIIKICEDGKIQKIR